MKYLFVITALLTVGCTTAPPIPCPEPSPTAPVVTQMGDKESDVAERYRYHLGSAYMHTLLSSLNINDLLLARAVSGDLEERDHQILANNLLGLRDIQSQFRRVLDELYESPERVRRDRQLIPMIDTMITMSEALERFTKTNDDQDFQDYTSSRKAFLDAIRSMQAP